MSRDVVRRELADIGNLVDESKVFAKATIVANSVAYTDLCTVTQAVSFLTSVYEDLPTLAAVYALTAIAQGPLKSRQGALPCLVPALSFSYACCGHANKTIADAAQECASVLCKVLVANEPLLPRCLEALVSNCDQVFKLPLSLSTLDSIRGSVAALKVVVKAQEKAPRELAACLPTLMPKLTLCVIDTNQKVAAIAKKAIEGALKVANNKDFAPFLTNYVDCIIDPSGIPELIDPLGGVVFTQPIDSPALAVMVPLLVLGLREDNSMAVKRTTVAIMGAMFTLSNDPVVHVPMLLPLLPGLEAVAAGSEIDAESRAICDGVIQQLLPVQAMEAAMKEIVEAAKGGNEDLVKKCIADGAKVDDFKDEHGFTALIWASYEGHTAILQLLIKTGAEVETKCKNGWTALVWAAQQGHVAAVTILLKVGTFKEAKNKALISAATVGRTAIVELILKAGANKNAPNKRGRTPLHQSSAHGHLATTQALIVAGADVSLKDKDGATPLDLATHGSACHALLENHVHMLAALRDAPTLVVPKVVSYCADLPNMDEENTEPMTTPGSLAIHFHPCFAWAPDTARHVAFAWARNAYVIQLAATTQPCEDLPDDCIGDVLDFFELAMPRVEVQHIVSHCSSSEACNWVRAVVNAAVATKATDNLAPAVRKGNVAGVKECLGRGANVDTELLGRTALIHASYYGYTDIVQLLLEAGANTEIKVETDTFDVTVTLLMDGSTALTVATEICHMATMKLLLEAGANPEVKDKDGDTALIIASKGGRSGLVKLLVESGANKEAKDKHCCLGEVAIHVFQPQKAYDSFFKIGRTPLAVASINSQLPAMAVLLQAGAYTGARDKNGDSVLLYAAREGRDHFVLKMLLEAGTFNNTSALMNTRVEDCNRVLLISAERGYTGVVSKLLCKAGINLNATDEGGGIALTNASMNGHLDIVKLLLEAGCDVDAKNKIANSTALMMASDKGHVAVVKLLLEAGADKEAKDKIGETALMWAADEGQVAVVELLLEADADKDAQSECGSTALINAAMNGRADTMKVLLEVGVDKDAQDKSGKSALFFGSKGTVKLLLEAGADANVKDESGDTMLILASMRGDDAIVEDLLLASADVAARSNDGKTALMNASETGHIAVVKLLLKAGADKDAQDEDGNTALIYASFHGYTIIVSLLLRKKKADVNIKNNMGNTALDYAYASKVRRKVTVKQLLEAGAKPEKKRAAASSP